MAEIAPIDPSKPSPAITRMGSEIKRDEQLFNRRSSDLAETQATTIAEREKTLAPLEADIQARIEEPTPTREKVDIPQFKPQPIIDAKEYEALSYGLIAMAMIGGVASQGKWLEVGNTLNGALKGYLEGNELEALKRYKDYDEQFKGAMAKEAQANREFENILKDRHMRIGDQINAYRIVAAKYDRQDALAAVQTRSLDRMWQSLEARKTAMARLEEANERALGAVPKAPVGYVWGEPDENGQPTLVPIKGGPAANKATAVDSRAVLALGRDLEKSKLTETIGVMEQAKKITPELAAFVTGPKSALPDLVVSPEAREARQAVQKLFNITLKDRSGAAVTDQEMERLRKEFGTGVFKSPEQLLDAIRKADSIIQKHAAGIAAGHGKAAFDAYNANLESIGGTPLLLEGLAPSAPSLPSGWSVKEK